MAHEFGCWMVCWLKPALNLFLFLGFLFFFSISVLALSPPVLRFYAENDWDSFFFQDAFRNKEREQKNYVSCVFKYIFACNCLRQTVRSEFWKTYALLRA